MNQPNHLLQVLTRLLEALEISVLSSYDEEAMTDDLVADEYHDRGLVECGRDQTGEGYTHLTRAGAKFIRETLEVARTDAQIARRAALEGEADQESSGVGEGARLGPLTKDGLCPLCHHMPDDRGYLNLERQEDGEKMGATHCWHSCHGPQLDYKGRPLVLVPATPSAPPVEAGGEDAVAHFEREAETWQRSRAASKQAEHDDRASGKIGPNDHYGNTWNYYEGLAVGFERAARFLRERAASPAPPVDSEEGRMQTPEVVDAVAYGLCERFSRVGKWDELPEVTREAWRVDARGIFAAVLELPPSEAELFPEFGKRIVAEEVRKTLLEPGGPMAAATNAVIAAELADDTEQACGIASQILGAAVHNAYGDGK